MVARDDALGPLYAVVGNPVEHSRSPEIHAAFARQTGEDMIYGRLLAPLDDFVGTVERFLVEGGCGLNVTLPFKEEAFAWVGEHDEFAGAAGAVNTIVRAAGAFRGCNTDGVGLVRDLEVNLGAALVGRRILVLGAGGAVRGVLGPLLGRAPREVVLVNRTHERGLRPAGCGLTITFLARNRSTRQRRALDVLGKQAPRLVHHPAHAPRGARSGGGPPAVHGDVPGGLMMNTHYVITKSSAPSTEQDFLESRLYEQNSTRTGQDDGQLFAFVVRNELEEIVAGISGWTWAHACEIRDVWVHPSLRGHGYGERLLTSAEEEAHLHECTVILRASYSFQAPGFYQKHGYKLAWRLDDFPPGHQYCYLVKRLG